MPNRVARFAFLVFGSVVAAVAISLILVRYQSDNFGRSWSFSASGRVGTAPIGNPVPPTPAAPGTGTGPPEDLLQVFASAPQVQLGQYSPQEMDELFTAFKHRPFASAGFNAVMLPFSYSDPGHIGDSSEAMALDALVSSDLDWSPGSYCTRHAFFEFKRDRDLIYALQKDYSPSLIHLLIRHWQATHAVGGELIRTADGYKGAMEIFGADGTRVFRHKYDTPRKFWDLLGDMDVDAMTFLDVKPSAKLVAYLHEPRCKLWQSLIDFGSAAFMAEHSPEEFALYEKILQVDPDFAFVRHWYASQRYWADGDEQRFMAQDGIAMGSRIEVFSLSHFDPQKCGDAALAAQYPERIDRAAELVSEDWPIVIDRRLANRCYGGQTRDEIVARGLKMAFKYPNSHYMCWQLALETQDQYLAAALYEAGLQDLYLPDMGKASDNEQLYLAAACEGIGRDDVAMEVLSEGGPDQSTENLFMLMGASLHGGRYGEAAQMYKLLSSRRYTDSMQIAAYAAFAAVVQGDKPLLDQVLLDHHDVLARANMADVFQAFRDAMDGKPVDPQQFVRPEQILDFPLVWRQLLLAWCDAKKGSSRYHRLTTEICLTYPITRQLWIAEDDYQRRDPSSDAAAFYDYLAWLFGDDPWVKKAVADFHSRGGRDPTVDPATLLADLKPCPQYNTGSQAELEAMDWKHLTTPWRVAACVHQLLKRGNVKDAEVIAGLYKKYEEGTSDLYRYSPACELLRRAEQAAK